VSLLIDTSVLIRAIGAPDDQSLNAVDAPWSVSVLSVGELEAGVLLARARRRRADRLRRLSAILSSAPVLPVDPLVSARYGELRAASGRAPSNDLWIAATAMAHDLTLVTADAAQARLRGLRARRIDC
jgi:predicted nucleic acid-binding protein